MRSRFRDFIIPTFGIPTVLRNFLGNNAIPTITTAGWFASQMRAVEKYPGAMPLATGRSLVTPQTILQGIPPFQALQVLANREAQLRVK